MSDIEWEETVTRPLSPLKVTPFIEYFSEEMPDERELSLENWLEVFDKYSENLNEQTVLIGHSLGATFILNVLEKYEQEVRGCFLVAGFTGKLGLEDFDPLNENFAEREFEWEKIRQINEEFFIYQARDDPYVPFEKAEDLEEKLDGNLREFEEGGHMNQDSGYTDFPRLLEDIKGLN